MHRQRDPLATALTGTHVGHGSGGLPQLAGAEWSARWLLALMLLNGVLTAGLAWGLGSGRVHGMAPILRLPATGEVVVIVDSSDRWPCAAILPVPPPSCERRAATARGLHLWIWGRSRGGVTMAPLVSVVVSRRQLTVVPGGSALALLALLLGVQCRARQARS